MTNNTVTVTIVDEDGTTHTQTYAAHPGFECDCAEDTAGTEYEGQCVCSFQAGVKVSEAFAQTPAGKRRAARKHAAYLAAHPEDVAYAAYLAAIQDGKPVDVAYAAYAAAREGK